MAAEQEREPLSGSLSQASMSADAVFLSYSSDDAVAAERIATALRSAGIQVWFDKSELRGGDAWDRQIRQQIHDCRLFVAVISAHTEARDEGYFRREWKLAVDRTHDMADKKAFLVPVVIDGTSERGASVPEKFHELQWTRLPDGETSPAFVERVRKLLSPELSPMRAPASAVPPGSAGVPAGKRAEPAYGRPKLVLWAIGAVLAVGLAYSVVDKLWLSKHVTAGMPVAASTGPSAAPTQGTIPEKSIAVLPFVDMSEKQDQEYFADGMAEEIINLLVKVPDLRVIGRTSSFQFKGKTNDLRKIGKDLGAAYVVEGSVRRSGDRVRVTAQLVTTSDDVHRWSNTYDRPFGDVFKLQDEIAAGIARAMEVTVSGDTLLSRTSGNTIAYDLYLRGLHSLERYDREGFATAANYFQQALDIDPNFAPAATELGRMVVFEVDFGFAPPIGSYERARDILQKAIRLDPQSGAAHAWLGWVYMAYEWNWDAAKSEMNEALRLSPRDPVVHLSAARLMTALGRLDESAQLLTSALATDPLYAAAMNSLSEVYARAGRLAEAEAVERRVLEMSPTYSSAPYNLAVALLLQGRAADAMELIKTSTIPSDRLAGLSMTYHALGRKADADDQLAALIPQYQDADAFQIAEVCAYLGEADEALSWLERAYRQRDPGLYFVKGDPLLKNLHGDPRYKAFLRKMNLPE